LKLYIETNFAELPLEEKTWKQWLRCGSHCLLLRPLEIWDS